MLNKQKNVNEKRTKNEPMSMLSPLQSHDLEGSSGPGGTRNLLRWEEFVEKVGFEPTVKE